MSITLDKSTYLDLTSYRGNAALPTSSSPLASFTVNVALVLDRAHDPTALLSGSWAARQAALADQTTVFKTYGADPVQYKKALDALDALKIPTLVDAKNYVSSVESRTIWVQLDQASFTKLFGVQLLQATQPDAFGNKINFWQGSLSLPDAVASAGIKGLWFDTTSLETAILASTSKVSGVALGVGSQGVGNAAHSGPAFPNAIADLYNFPFATPALSTSVPTGKIGLIEPGIGTAVADGASFQDLLNTYRTAAGISVPAPTVIDVAPGGQKATTADERSLDVGVATTVNPLSQLVLYAGSGTANGAHNDVFAAYQQAFWDTTNNPSVISSSFKSYPRVAPDSPFYNAIKELFVDAALRKITMVNAAGDGGSGDEYANGLTNVAATHASPYSVMAGGGSLSTIKAASQDPTLNGTDTGFPNIYAAAMAGDRATLWQLMAGGLKVLPATASSSAMLVEAAWNGYLTKVDANDSSKLGLNPGYLDNNAGSGGVDPTQAQPWYQTAFGLDLHTADPQALPGRGAPDVAATSGGNMGYLVPQPDMTGTQGIGGTSAAAPLWASLFSQVNAVFHDQGLPDLGYTNDLLYIAAAIAPAAFNDIMLGNNVSSLVLGGNQVYTPPPKGSPVSSDVNVTPTGYGYYAGPGYDLTTGLGSPDGLLLARALTAIGHAQTSYATTPKMLDANGAGGWLSGTSQTLLFQTMSAGNTAVDIGLGSGSLAWDSAPSGTYAWTNRLAQQMMQPDFDPALVRLFDKQAQGWIGQSSATASEPLAVSIDKSAALALQGTLSSPYGFADFTSPDGAVRVARPVAIAETAGGANDTMTIVRMRQGGENSVSVSFYQVDDLNGTVGGIAPGQAGYADAAALKTYTLANGSTSVTGPGFGNFLQTGILHVDAGDLIAMKLTNNSTGLAYWAFAQANESVGGRSVGHLWNYGLDTWGWEDTFGGGDRDFNDVVVQLDFTSAQGHGWLI